MESRSRHARSRRYRRRLRRDSRAVVSVVGTLLALLVFFALFGVFLTQYVPIWMTENEQALAVQDQSALAQLKSNIDLQATDGGPPVFSTPFQLSSQGIPLVAQPTTGTITFIPSSPGVFANVSLRPGPGNAGGLYWQNISLGTLSMQLPNRYYSPQSFSLENDAVLQAQGNGQQLVDFPPTFALNSTGAGIGVTATIIQLSGASTQATSTGSQEVFSHLVFSQTITSTSPTATLKATFYEGTLFPCAWDAFVNSTIAQSGINFNGHYPTITPSLASCTTGTSPFPVKVTFTNLASFTLIYAQIRLVIGVGVE